MSFKDKIKGKYAAIKESVKKEYAIRKDQRVEINAAVRAASFKEKKRLAVKAAIARQRNSGTSFFNPPNAKPNKNKRKPFSMGDLL